MAKITRLLAWLLLIPIAVNQAQPLGAEQPPMPPAQVAAQNSQLRSAVATILQSGSTNARGYGVTIYDDGSATAVLNAAESALQSSPARTQQFPAGTIDAGRLQALLTQIGDVSTIPAGRCAKSVSFGTRTQISYQAKISGDLQCIRGPAQGPLLRTAEELSQLVRDILSRLSVNTRRLVSEPQP